MVNFAALRNGRLCAFLLLLGSTDSALYALRCRWLLFDDVRGPSSQVPNPNSKAPTNPSSDVPANPNSEVQAHKSQPSAQRSQLTSPGLESSRPNSSLLRCSSSQIPARTSSRVPIQRPQLRNHGIQPLQCWGASTAYGSDSSHSAAAELTRAMAIMGGHGMVGTALRHAFLHMLRRHFALAVMAGARANKLQLAVTLRGASGATGLRRPHQSKPLGTGGLAARCHGTKGELLAERFMNSSAAAMKEVPPQYSSGQSAR